MIKIIKAKEVLKRTYFQSPSDKEYSLAFVKTVPINEKINVNIYHNIYLFHIYCFRQTMLSLCFETMLTI